MHGTAQFVCNSWASHLLSTTNSAASTYYSVMIRVCITNVYIICIMTHILQELIRRWDSERELLYDDNIHVEASADAN